MEAQVPGLIQTFRKSSIALACAAVIAAVAAHPASAEWGDWDDDETMLGRAASVSAEHAPDATMSEMLLAQSDDEDDFDDSDPLEDLNRIIFDINEFLYDITLRPLSYVYNNFLPDHLRYMLGGVYDTLSQPVTIANDILQLEFDRAADATARMVLNATFGFGGINDLATEFGIEKHSEDFGQTMAVWGVPEGFYLVLPVFGPSSPRDAVGKFLVDGYFNPTSYALKIDLHPRDSISAGLRIGGGIHQFSDVVDELDDIKKTSIDYYAAIRSLYRQKRASDILNGQEIDVPPIPELGYDLDIDGYEEEDSGMAAIENGDGFGGVLSAAADGPARSGIEALVSAAASNAAAPASAPAPASARTSVGVEVAETPLVRSFGSAGTF